MQAPAAQRCALLCVYLCVRRLDVIYDVLRGRIFVVGSVKQPGAPGVINGGCRLSAWWLRCGAGLMAAGRARVWRAAGAAQQGSLGLGSAARREGAGAWRAHRARWATLLPLPCWARRACHARWAPLLPLGCAAVEVPANVTTDMLGQPNAGAQRALGARAAPHRLRCKLDARRGLRGVCAGRPSHMPAPSPTNRRRPAAANFSMVYVPTNNASVALGEAMKCAGAALPAPQGRGNAAVALQPRCPCAAVRQCRGLPPGGLFACASSHHSFPLLTAPGRYVFFASGSTFVTGVLAAGAFDPMNCFPTGNDLGAMVGRVQAFFLVSESLPPAFLCVVYSAQPVALRLWESRGCAGLRRIAFNCELCPALARLPPAARCPLPLRTLQLCLPAASFPHWSAGGPAVHPAAAAQLPARLRSAVLCPAGLQVGGSVGWLPVETLNVVRQCGEAV